MMNIAFKLNKRINEREEETNEKKKRTRRRNEREEKINEKKKLQENSR